MKQRWLLIVILISLLFYGSMLPAQTIEMRLPDTSVVRGEYLELPVFADSSLTGKGVTSYFLEFRYNPYCLQFDSVITEGTVSGAFGSPVVKNVVSDPNIGILTIAGAGFGELNGFGLFIKVRFKAMSNAYGTEVVFTSTKRNYFNEGTPILTYSQAGCYISILESPSITVNAESYTLCPGETLQMNVWDGTIPYVWSVIDPAVASVNTEGLLTALKVGNTNVVAVDATGIRDTSEIIQVHPFRLSIPDDLTQWVGKTIRIPVLVSDLTGLNCTSGSFRLWYDTGCLSYEGIEQTGTQLESYVVSENNRTTGTVLFAFAGSTPLEGNDTLLNVLFRITGQTYGTTVSVSNACFNETLTGVYSNGRIVSKNNADMDVYPDDASLIVGESIDFSVYGAIEPSTWSVSNPLVASISQDGWLTALKSGTVTITVVDSASTSVSTGTIIVRDARVLISDTAICNFENTLYFPVTLKKLAGAGSVYSMEGTLSVDTANLEVIGLSNSGTLTQGWNLVYNPTYDSQTNREKITFAISGTQALNETGFLFYIVLKPKQTFGIYSSCYVSIDDMLLNEGIPSILFNNYACIRGIESYQGQVYIYASPEYGLCLGDSVFFQSNVCNVNQPVYQWLVNGVDVPRATGESLTINSLHSEDSVVCRVTSGDPCIVNPILNSNTISLTVNEPPARPDTIYGDTIVYKGSSWQEYSVPFDSHAEYYSWHFPEGFGYEGSYSSIAVAVSDTACSGWVSAVALDQCGASDTAYLYIKVVEAPVYLDSIHGDTVFCREEYNYFWLEDDPESDEYVWTFPNGFIIEGDSTYSAVLVYVTDSAQSGTIRVHGVRNETAGLERELSVVVLGHPSTPAEIFGPDMVSRKSEGLIFSVDPVNDATWYEWFLPDGFHGNSDSSSIMVNIDQWAISDSVLVKACNSCGNSGWTSKYVRVTLTLLGNDTIYGSDVVCKNSDDLLYSVDEITEAEGYQWTLPAGFTGESTENQIWVNITDTALSGNISVVAYNGMDSSQVISRFIEVKDLPGTPSGIFGATVIDPGTYESLYYVSYNADALGYIWELPEGTEGYDTSSDTILIAFSDSAKSGWIKVRAVGYCGTGPADSLYVSVNYVGLNREYLSIGLYPNPVKDRLHLILDILQHIAATVVVYDVYGRILDICPVRDRHEIILDFSKQNPGLYMVKIGLSGKIEYYKVLKE